MANKPYPTPANLSEQLVNLGWRLATEMRALHNTVNTKVSREDADAAYLGKTAKAESAKTADVATKATQDGNGKNIASTYALKTSIPIAMKGATSTAAGSAGTVPAPAAGDQNKFLTGSGTWTTALTSQTQTDWNATTGIAAIKNKPTIPTKTSQLTNDSDFAMASAIPKKVSQLTNDSGYLTTQIRADWNATEGFGVINNKPTIPTKVSQLTNDSGYLSTQQQADWNASSGVTAIKNKPTIPTTMRGATASAAGASGVVPAPAAGSQTKYLRGDGTWQTVSASIPNYTFTASTQGGRIVKVLGIEGTIDSTSSSGSGGLTSTSYSFSTTPGITAGTYSLQHILQQLINLSHSHKTAKGAVHYNCNCDCNCTSTSGDTDG